MALRSQVFTILTILNVVHWASPLAPVRLVIYIHYFICAAYLLHGAMVEGRDCCGSSLNGRTVEGAVERTCAS